MRKRRANSEAVIQRAVFLHLHTRGAPGVFAFHPANGGYRKPIEAAIMKGLGVVAGVPDVIAIHRGCCYAMELKREGGRATEKQLETIAALGKAGAFTCIAEGLDRALATLEAWGLLRGRVGGSDGVTSNEDRDQKIGSRASNEDVGKTARA